MKGFGRALIAITCATAPLAAAPTPNTVIKRIDLSKPFHLPPGASFVATQGPAIDNPVYDGEKDPGRISLCVRARTSAACAPTIDGVLDVAGDRSSGIHYLEVSEIVYPRGADERPLLHLQVASIHAGNGSQGHAAIILGYNPAHREFEQIFDQIVGGNMNQAVRYISTGPLMGAMVSAEPTSNAPYAYWITVNRFSADYRYRRVLHYRSATHYNDGNTLAVIDSEMPNILRKLGLWHPGDPLPLPPSSCPKPRLVKSELWCN